MSIPGIPTGARASTSTAAEGEATYSGLQYFEGIKPELLRADRQSALCAELGLAGVHLSTDKQVRRSRDTCTLHEHNAKQARTSKLIPKFVLLALQRAALYGPPHVWVPSSRDRMHKRASKTPLFTSSHVRETKPNLACTCYF